MKREFKLWALTKNGMSRDYATKSEEAVRVKVTIEPLEEKR